MPLPATTRLFEIKLHGIEGLIPRFFGDVDRTISTPNLRVANQNNQDAVSGSYPKVADGVYNPFRRYGYLSASNTSFTTIQFASSNTSTNLQIAMLFDRENDNFYSAEAGKLWLGSTLDSTNLTAKTLVITSEDTITDLEVYQVNGVRKLFYSYFSTAHVVTVVNGTGVWTMSSGVAPANGTPVTFTNSGGSLPTNLVAGTTYYVTTSSALTFHISATLGGADFAVSSNGTGITTIHGNFGGIGISNLPFDTQHDIWLAQTVSGAFNMGANYHVMIPADNSFLYVLDGNAVHKIDGTLQSGGTNGTVTPNNLIFPTNFNLVDGVDYRGNLFIGIHQFSSNIRGVSSLTESFTSRCGVYLWDKQNTVTGSKDYIPLEGVKEIRKIYVAPTGVVRLIAISAENITQIMEYTGSTFKVICEVGYNSYPEYIDSFAKVTSYVVWIGNDGYIYAHGSVSPFDAEGIFKLGQKTTFKNAGAILYGGSNSYSSGGSNEKAFRSGLIIAYNNNTNNVCVQWDIHGTGKSGSGGGNMHAGNVYTPVYYMTEVLGYTHYPSQLANLNYIQIYCSPTGISDSIPVFTINLFLNQSTTAFASYVVTSAQASRGYYRMEVNEQYVNAVQLQIVFPTGNTISNGSSYDTGLSTAVLVYEPTNTKG